MTTLRRGFTLAEQMVVAGLLSLVLAAAALVLQPCLVEWRTVQDQSDMQRNATMAAERMRRELQASSKSSLTVSTTPPAVSFLAASATGAAYDPVAGTPMWDHFVIYFLDTQNRVLYRKQWPGDGGVAIPDLPYTFPSTSAAVLAPAELAAICATSNGSERVVASMVDGIVVRTDSQVTTVDLSLSVPTPRGPSVASKRVAACMRVQ